MSAALADRIDAVLPQTQCGRCGYDRCRPYAQALADGTAPINRCPPGGRATIEVLASLTSQPVLPLDARCGSEAPIAAAWIDEPHCIGCTLCIQACPVDAIVGAARRMHTVVASLCTGCERCVAPCPVDCIVMIAAAPPRTWTRADADGARRRMQARDERLEQERMAAERRLAAQAEEPPSAPIDPDAMAGVVGIDAATSRRWSPLRTAVSQAIARARARHVATPRS